MHELSVALSILDVAADEAERRGGLSVVAIHLRLGPLSGVVKQALLNAFDLAGETSPLGDCKLIIEEVPVVVFCPQCQGERPVRSIQEICCDVCGTPSPNVVSGREMEITALEVTE